MTQREELPVSVKALEWEYAERPTMTYTAYWPCDGGDVAYYINQRFGSDSYYFETVCWPEGAVYEGDDLPSAQSAAQADFEARILSALVASPKREATDHTRGCQGREYTCTCGYDDERDADTFTYAVRVEGAYREGWLDRECDEYLDVDHGWTSSDTLRALTALAGFVARPGKLPPANEYGNLAENAEYISVQNSRIEMLEAELAQARKALEPFASCDPMDVYESEDDDANGCYVLTQSDFHRARAALITDPVRTEGEQK